MVDLIYKSPLGRWIMIVLQKTGVFRLASWFLKTRLSRFMIPYYIKKHHIDMREFAGQQYDSFGAFFGRKREDGLPGENTGKENHSVLNSQCLMSPCDGLLSCYPVTEAMILPMKGSLYRLTDIVPDETVAREFVGGVCLVFRLQASDYHHFCAFDDTRILETRFLDGELHSVQPIACNKVPVYRLNRRWWSVMDTVHFGKTVQMEIGAMMVGGVHFEKETGWLYRGDAMGHFELAGSTILLLLSEKTGKRLKLYEPFQKTWFGKTEVPVRMGEKIGGLQHESASVDK